MFWLLLYDLADDYLERRPPLRSVHLALAKAAHASGALVYAGALDDPADRAVFVWHTDDPTVIEEFARHDPYVEEGLVTSWQVRRWNAVIGPDIEPPAG
jgi:uncharacterized protein YciI